MKVKCEYLICDHNDHKGNCLKEQIHIQVRDCSIDNERSLLPECLDMEIFNENWNWEKDKRLNNELQEIIAYILSKNGEKGITKGDIIDKCYKLLNISKEEKKGFKKEIERELDKLYYHRSSFENEEYKEKSSIIHLFQKKNEIYSLTKDQRVYLKFLLSVMFPYSEKIFYEINK